MRLPRRLAALLVAGVVATGLAGCEREPVAAPVAASPSPTGPPAEALVRAAALETDKRGSARYSLTTATTVNGAEVVFTGNGIYDWARDTGQTTYDVPVGTVLQRLIGPKLYLSLPQQPKQFFVLRSADVANSPVGATVDPTAQFHALAAVTAAEVVGEQEVRGEPTTHYRGTYDVPRAIRGARGLQKDALRSSLGAAATLPEAPYDVFVDSAGLLRRVQQTIEVPSSTGGALTVTMTLELYDFGIEVTVVPPPPTAQRDGGPLLAALRKALPAPTSAPPASPKAPAASPKAPVASPTAG